MLREIDDKPAPCWIVGEPKKSGLFLTRWDYLGTAWFWLFESVMDDILPERERRGRPFLFDNRGADYAFNIRTTNGKLTHHCEATPENFAMIVESLAHYTYDENERKFKRVTDGS